MLGQLFRFGLSGFINTIIDFTVFNLLIYITGIHNGIILALINAIAVAVAALNSYFINRSWTFNSRGRGSRQFFRFILATATGLAINSLTVIAIASISSAADFSSWALLNGGKIVASILSASWNFLSYRYWVFPQTDDSSLHMKQPCIPGLVSIVIPAYNESRRIPLRLQKLAQILPAHFPLEIIVVDDGSKDNTLALVREFAGTFPFIKCLHYTPNQGKGKAVQTGILAARGEYLVYTDADDTFTAEHIKLVVENLKAGHKVVIACRSNQNYRRLDGEPGLRTIMGRTFNWLVQLFLLPGLKDTQCGLKGFQRDSAARIFPLLTVKRFAFDLEILALARSLNIKIIELPVAARDCTGSQVNCWLAPCQMCWDLLKIKVYLFINRYGIPGGNQAMLQFAVAVLLFLTALAVRIPWLWEVPRFIDELKEVNLAYQIYSGQILPLHNMAHDIGALHNYILAIWFKLLGPGIYWPRLYVAITAALTVTVLYKIAYRCYGQTVALIAAGLLLTNGMHILVTHMAWSNCTTPFFFSLALGASLAAQGRKSGQWLVISAFLWAMALQTHSSIIVFLPAYFLYVIRPEFRRETGFSMRCYLLAAAAFVAGYANMIYYNLVTSGGSLRWLTHKSYAVEADPGISSYLNNLNQLVIELLRSLSSTFVSHESWFQYLQHPAFLLFIVLLGTGIYYTSKSSYTLPVWLLLAGSLIIPIVNERYAFYVSTRYIMPQIILSILLSAMGAVKLIETIKKYPRVNMNLPLTAAVACFLIILQLYPIYRYCYEVAETNASNRMALSIMDMINSQGKEKTVLIDKDLPLENEPLPALLTLREQPYQIVDAAEGNPGVWMKYLNEYNSRNMVVVVGENTFKKLRYFIPSTHISILSSRIAIPNPSAQEKKVFVIKLENN